MNQELAFEKLRTYCAYQERCHSEVVDKGYKLGLYKTQIDQVLLLLLEENLLNEERFAKAYVSGKFRIKKWGRTKIKANLKQKKISEYCIKKGLQEIDEEEYLEAIEHWIEKRKLASKEKNLFKQNGEIASFLRLKGFESSLVWDFLNNQKN